MPMIQHNNCTGTIAAMNYSQMGLYVDISVLQITYSISVDFPRFIGVQHLSSEIFTLPFRNYSDRSETLYYHSLTYLTAHKTVLETASPTGYLALSTRK